MDGRYRIDTAHIRSQALICHALDLQFDRLVNSETICGKSGALIEAYEQLFATNLLNLAVSVRVALRDDPEYRSFTSGIAACALLERGLPAQSTLFSIKDVCDKIIHADEISRLPEEGVRGSGCSLRGNKHGDPWELGLGLSIFCEVILDWLDRIEARA